MKRKAAKLVSLSVLLASTAAIAAGAPGIPHNFYGEVSYDNGTQIDTGTVNVVLNKSNATFTEFNDGTYSVKVNASVADTGDLLHFYVNNVDTDQTATWQSGSSEQLDLTVSQDASDEGNETQDEGQDTGGEEDTDNSEDTSSSSSSGSSGGSYGGSYGGSSSSTNEAPVAGFTVETAPVRPNTTVVLNASESFDEDGEIVAYNWSVDANGPVVETMFSAVGTYNVTLTVTDDDGAATSVTNDVTVMENQLPVPRFTVVYNYSTYEDGVTFDASDSYDPDGRIAAYEWSFGKSGEEAVTAFDSPGERQVTLSVIDNEGGIGTVTRTVTIEEPESTDDGTVRNNASKDSLTGAVTADGAVTPVTIAAGTLLVLAVGVLLFRRNNWSFTDVLQ